MGAYKVSKHVALRPQKRGGSLRTGTGGGGGGERGAICKSIGCLYLCWLHLFRKHTDSSHSTSIDKTY